MRRADSTSFLSASTPSLFPPLPTPDFTQPPRFLSFFPRGLSFFSTFPRPAFSRASSSESEFTGNEASRSRQQSVCSDSWRSAGSYDSDSNAIDSGQRALIQSIGTTDKFTHKWPRPQSLRTYGMDVGTDSSLESSEDGLGIDTAESWTGFKWFLLFSVCTVFAYGAASLVCALMTWFHTWNHADVMYIADNDILILITLAGSLLIFTSLVGLSGVLLNSRSILAVYTVLLWPALISLTAIGYVAYKRATFSLDRKLNLSWSQFYTPLGRLLIQDSLRCCGFYSPLHEATPSKRCYPRASLPGCKGKLYRFEAANLALVWSTVFSLVPLHLLNVLVALLCSNHVTDTFRRGITPKKYRLTSADAQADADKIIMRRMGLEHQISPRVSASAIHDDGDGDDSIPFLSYTGQQY
ncbi:hypothetical protein B0H12DRAFT_1014784 [Mycena haematopus]|nr:hypothetical protein B0H12DRAFT_1014784 [Mycena haematopus]